MKRILFIALILSPFWGLAQNVLSQGKISGNFQMDAQYYFQDSAIGAPDGPEKLLVNGFANLLYTNGNFTAGLRYENFLNPMLGYDKRYKGNGISYRFATYKNDNIEVTVGNYYEQFGSGLILRTYENWNLGFDNSLDGLRVKYTPFAGVTVKGVIGRQRFFFEKPQGLVRGADVDVSLNDFISKYKDAKLKITLGGSFVSKFQEDQDPLYKLPANVGAYAGRISMNYGRFDFMGEYAHKINDPSTVNNFIYKDGEALFLNLSYSQKGLGISLSGKRVDNMDFRSDRTQTGNVLNINYLPTISKEHTYSLAAYYPYSTQPNGEMGYQAQIDYKIKKGSFLGGKYGTNITLNFSKVNSIDRKNIDDSTYVSQPGTLGYSSSFFSFGKETYFQDFNLEVGHKFSKKFKMSAMYVNMIYNYAIIQGHLMETGDSLLYGDIAIVDMSFALTENKTLRLEFEHLSTVQDKGNWIMGMAELSIAPKWFFSLTDRWNYGNKDASKQFHYYNVGVAYVHNTSRIALVYGKQVDGVVCVGGVCRAVPASNGVTLTITSSF